MFDLEKFRTETKNSNDDGWDQKLRTLQELSHDEFINVCVQTIAIHVGWVYKARPQSYF